MTEVHIAFKDLGSVAVAVADKSNFGALFLVSVLGVGSWVSRGFVSALLTVFSMLALKSSTNLATLFSPSRTFTLCFGTFSNWA